MIMMNSNKDNMVESVQQGLKEGKTLREEIVEFYMVYVICTLDKDKAVAGLSRGESIFSLANSSDAAFAAVTYVDNYNGWKDAYSNIGNREWKKPTKNPTRWKKVRGKKEFKDRMSPQAKDFYTSSEEFFGALYTKSELGEEVRGLLDGECKEWWKKNGKVRVVKERVQTKRYEAPEKAPVIPKLMLGGASRIERAKVHFRGRGSSATTVSPLGELNVSTDGSECAGSSDSDGSPRLLGGMECAELNGTGGFGVRPQNVEQV